MLCADATSTVLRKYALSASSCSNPANCRFVVERLMLITSKPCSTAQRRPPSRMGPLPLKPAPRTRALIRVQSGASARTIPAQAVPCPQRSPSVSSTSSIWSSSPTRLKATAWSILPTSGWPASTPLSRMQTRTPWPVEPPQAHSRVTRSGHLSPIEIWSAPPAARLQAGRLSAWSRAGSCCDTRGSYAGDLVVCEEAADLVDHTRLGLDAFCLERGLEVGEQRGAEFGVCLCSHDDLVDLRLRRRQLLCRLHPAHRGRGKHPDQPREGLCVIVAHHVTCSLDGSGGLFLPSKTIRSLSRQREMRLAIVPAGKLRLSPIVR